MIIPKICWQCNPPCLNSPFFINKLRRATKASLTFRRLLRPPRPPTNNLHDLLISTANNDRLPSFYIFYIFYTVKLPHAGQLGQPGQPGRVGRTRYPPLYILYIFYTVNKLRRATKASLTFRRLLRPPRPQPHGRGGSPCRPSRPQPTVGAAVPCRPPRTQTAKRSL